MDCAEEVSLLRARLSRVAGVRDLQFDVMQARMVVEYSPDRVSEPEIVAAVNSIGMECEPWSASSETAADQRQWRPWLVWISGAALGLGMVVQGISSGGEWAAVFAHEAGGHEMSATAIAFYVLAMLTGASATVPKAWVALRHARPDMNLLVVLSLAGATALGEWTEAATLSFLFALAGRMEQWSMERARRAIAAVWAVSPPSARVVHGDHEHLLAVERVTVGALVRVKSGERVPVDGEVAGGWGMVNQALITGESVAVEKWPGAQVWAGTMNEEGTLEVRATKAAADTTLARMMRMVSESQTRRAPSEQFVEKFARHYTPAVFALALAVALFPPALGFGTWAGWFYQGMVILLIACPCALVISTPVSMMAAITSAAREGVLIKGGAFLEEAARVSTIALGAADLTPGLVARERVVVLDEADRAAQVSGLGPGVAVVGVSAEDLPAMGAAALGIGLSRRGPDMVRESADVILMSDRLSRLPFLLAHARRTLRTVRLNTAFALTAKALFLAAAAAGVATLWMAVAADMGATFAVTLNGLRLLRARARAEG
jgi:Cd2+/Zn2+-exporting ATPase